MSAPLRKILPESSAIGCMSIAKIIGREYPKPKLKKVKIGRNKKATCQSWNKHLWTLTTVKKVV